ncbi:cobaltochelatase subunit CobN [Dissulfurispira thermophila]|uniref:Cobaltochelatase subunit CobN n=1 Tax=Dissulfurispira thermophila TaxID=2715679 RepID=A0A7G1GZN1_9BACT|nr:cobaltochelatase subunit CobN [Dissulfurispira thermophila]BCB95950.1 cobaltochelatase subunit CobN [Dissulfurispira thermophila]
MKILAIMWSTYLQILKEAAKELNIDLEAYSNKHITQKPEALQSIFSGMKEADLILLYRTGDAFWEDVEGELKNLCKKQPVIMVGSDPSYWTHSTVDLDIVGTVYRYILFNGKENFLNMFRYILNKVFKREIDFKWPEEIAWQGICHPNISGAFQDIDDYLDAYKAYWAGHYQAAQMPSLYAGLLYSRSSWITGNIEIERFLVSFLEERGIGVIPVFFYPLKDEGLGNMSGVEIIEKFFVKEGSPIVDGIIKLSMFFLANARGEFKESDATGGVSLLKRLNIPLFCPVTSYYKDKDEWLNDPEGLGAQVAWSIAMPEFEGAIEPLIIGATKKSGTTDEAYEAIEDRLRRFADRVTRWFKLSKKPTNEKKVAFILHNNPCASVEATVGSGAHLDTLESVAQILKRMEKAGYMVSPPENGKELIDTIMERKAISEFRWTTIEEIVDKGGVLAKVDKDTYMRWFNELPEKTRRRMSEAWGNPPGEPKDGIPAAMVHDGRIVVTGVSYGNAIVCVQPKRGCAGARCDGQVCKILHDPDVPPPHQYVATYKWLSREFGADVIVHVGTHGNLEFLPGKATGLSSGCFPDIGIDSMPHLYIYNADNPPEGTIAKRRSYATLVNHIQAVMVQGELYGDLEEIERLLESYERYKNTEPAKAHTISHLITDKVKGLNISDINHDNFDEKVKEIHEKLSLYKNTYIPKGMHIFGKLPEGDRFSDFIYAIVRYENTPDSLRGIVSNIISEVERLSDDKLSDDKLKEKTDAVARKICKAYLDEGVELITSLSNLYPQFSGFEDLITTLKKIEAQIDDVKNRTLLSDEMGSLFNGFNAGYIPPGPSGIMTRGRSDILPTGRNFYSLDPHRVPTEAAWEVGLMLAQKTIDKYLLENGTYPENIAFYWMCNDIMWADGEGMAQMMYLIGVKPVWAKNGRVKSFEIIPLEKLRRPRIDLTIRVSGITRDNFPNCIDMLDEAIQSVAVLDEPVEMNFVRKHALEKLEKIGKSDENSLRKATYRIFASMPGTYQAGTQLAVYASAWKDEKDLADVFIYWNGYAYGKGVFGEPAHNELKSSLKTVKVSFNKTVTDEYDLTGCCCYFGTHGGMIAAAKAASGEEIKNYYGDTREQGEVQIRTLKDEVRRIARAKILNPKWIEGMKEHGYKGASEISKRVGRLYGWQATSKEVDGEIFDDITRTFMMNEDNRKFFEENNPYALEEIARRLIEAAERGLWEPAPDVKDALKKIYIEIEGWIEEKMGDIKGEFQGGSIDIITKEEVEGWKKKMMEVLK